MEAGSGTEALKGQALALAWGEGLDRPGGLLGGGGEGGSGGQLHSGELGEPGPCPWPVAVKRACFLGLWGLKPCPP